MSVFINNWQSVLIFYTAQGKAKITITNPKEQEKVNHLIGKL
jgi:hypothetical protein